MPDVQHANRIVFLSEASIVGLQMPRTLAIRMDICRGLRKDLVSSSLACKQAPNFSTPHDFPYRAQCLKCLQMFNGAAGAGNLHHRVGCRESSMRGAVLLSNGMRAGG